MNILGHEKTSFIDYPGKICTMYFVGGCNLKCGYCHNKDLVENKGVPILQSHIFEFLKKRKKYIDGVCISGGEPTLYEELYDFIVYIKKEGLLVKLDTNGTNPSILRKLIDENIVDYIAMDVKAPMKKYHSVTNVVVNVDKIKESINLLTTSNMDYEFRTTVCKELVSREDILEIANELKGSNRYIIQNFRDRDTVLEGKNKFTSYNKEELECIKEEIKDYFNEIKIR
ncbi:MAG: anaerobic ribonucleoside-triphosphate reductase activating protein [Anaeromicrobium sp.]|jgi:pyruvate formate lyase activating enzyme|uniref:anaerobic ribonucleoside-triphosphate reductase activating protein n=1 Tax=Anaeromicrobium sp. TaxID=1929132 RepID=UPI0025D9E845|nr:anaerobic ribonucleoside-triphosphate reductase activating protein [Anaeromicrobium sp.]MCT4593879.1 anaerobic ribonucleoside-triphosphate reductase activating protein [Anaeromicrobium sp.]